MIRFIADEGFDGPVIAGVRRRHTHVQIQTIQELGMSGTSDPEILAWATERDLVVLSRDVNTLKAYGEDRIRRGVPLSCLLLVHDRMSRAVVIDQIEMWSRREIAEAFAYPIQYIRPH